MKKFAIISDTHFGHAGSSLSSAQNQNYLAQFLKQNGPYNELVLLGDILDLNVSTLFCSVEGTPKALSKSGKRLEGFRSFLERILVEHEVKINRIVYVPGNHDYFIFQQEAICSGVISKLRSGKKLTGKPLLFLRSASPFLSGIVPEEHRSKVVLAYPNYTIQLEKGKHIFCTHGHYLDRSQTLAKKIEAVVGDIEPKDMPKHKRKVRVSLMRRSAQYQMLLKELASSRTVRDLFSGITLALDFAAHITSVVRGQRIRKGMIEAIEEYIYYFHNGPEPKAFIFGHTHVQDQAWSSNHLNLNKSPILIWNTGGFVPSKKRESIGSFIILEHTQDRSLPEAIRPIAI